MRVSGLSMRILAGKPPKRARRPFAGLPHQLLNELAGFSGEQCANTLAVAVQRIITIDRMQKMWYFI